MVLVGWWFIRVNLVIGRSMSPTLNPWDVCISLRTRDYRPARGEIITFRTRDDPPMRFVKRVVGLPGETLAIAAGRVIVDGRVLAEPYSQSNESWNLEAVRIPHGKLYVLSDNRSAGLEDYVQGLIATRLVEVRVAWHWRVIK